MVCTTALQPLSNQKLRTILLKSTLHTFLMNSFTSHPHIFNREETMAKRVNLHQNPEMVSNQNQKDRPTILKDHQHGQAETVSTDIQKLKLNHRPISSLNAQTQFTFQRK